MGPMVASEPDAETLTLHAVRLLGYAEAPAVARRFGRRLEDATEDLLDLEAAGCVARSGFAGSSGWSLTDRGRVEDERRLAVELDAVGGRAAVTGVYERFLPLNARFQDAVTRWQVRPLPGAPLAANDHTDHRWDDRVLDTLASVGRRLGRLDAELTAVLSRFEGYDRRYAAALDRAVRGEDRWVDGLGTDSCHTVWMQLHEDLIATLGLRRGQEPPPHPERV